ncbi:MAG: 4Fe-4S dicluster domain-containing protein [Elusimicrobia bacterium]|nr:4Fe-4S dicluster domain-containing protein [Elusimicrobiota bacterium]
MSPSSGRSSRRDFLKTALAAGAAGLAPRPASAAPKPALSPDRMGVLVDTTVCIGCRNCEWACKTAHALPTEPLKSYEDKSVFEKFRRPDDKALTVVNRFDAPKDAGTPHRWAKIQCMHCDRPACVSACIVGALSKSEDGSVLWSTRRCIGCRYCMVACPFQVPAFEYHKALEPSIRKCDFCHDRRRSGGLPACVESCPVEALTYGPREELIRVARARTKRYPQRYASHIYGESEVGGTSWLYLAGGDFADLRLPRLGPDPAPGVSESIQHGIFAYFIPPASLYGLLGLLMWISKNRPERGPHGPGE